MSQRTEVPRPWRVVLQQQPVVVRQPGKDLAGDALIPAIGQPAATGSVAATDVDGARNTSDALKYRIVNLRVSDQFRCHVVPP